MIQSSIGILLHQNIGYESSPATSVFSFGTYAIIVLPCPICYSRFPIQEVIGFPLPEPRKKREEETKEMKVQYAKPTSVQVECKDSVFNIKNVNAGNMKTLLPEEFSTNLKLFFGKISDQEVHQVDTAQLVKEALKS